MKRGHNDLPSTSNNRGSGPVNNPPSSPSGSNNGGNTPRPLPPSAQGYSQPSYRHNTSSGLSQLSGHGGHCPWPPSAQGNSQPSYRYNTSSGPSSGPALQLSGHGGHSPWPSSVRHQSPHGHHWPHPAHSNAHRNRQGQLPPHYVHRAHSNAHRNRQGQLPPHSVHRAHSNVHRNRQGPLPPHYVHRAHRPRHSLPAHVHHQQNPVVQQSSALPVASTAPGMQAHSITPGQQSQQPFPVATAWQYQPAWNQTIQIPSGSRLSHGGSAQSSSVATQSPHQYLNLLPAQPAQCQQRVQVAAAQHQRASCGSSTLFSSLSPWVNLLPSQPAQCQQRVQVAADQHQRASCGSSTLSSSLSPSVNLLPSQPAQCPQLVQVAADQHQRASPVANSPSSSQTSSSSQEGSSSSSGHPTPCGHQPAPSAAVAVPSSSLGQPPVASSVASQDFWLRCIKDWYPDRHKKAYFLPPQYFRRTQHSLAALAHIGDLPVLVSEPPSKKLKKEEYPPQSSQPQLAQLHPSLPVAGSVFTLPHSNPAPLPRYQQTDILDDETAERLFDCLRVLSPGEAMMVISQLDFRRYLDDDTDPISKAACANLPRPVSMHEQNYHDGDFDALVIHRHYGLLVCEVKAVGADRRNTPDLNKAVVGKVKRALEQLNKAQDVLNHLVSDMTSKVRVTKTLVLPNVTSAELTLALCTSCQLQQELGTATDMHQALSAACQLKQELSTVPSLQQDCGSLDLLQQELTTTGTLKQTLDRACQLQQDLSVACKPHNDLRLICKIQKELTTGLELLKDLDCISQLHQDVSNATQILQKELTTACQLQKDLSSAFQPLTTAATKPQLEYARTISSQLERVFETNSPRLEQLRRKSSQLFQAVTKAAELHQVLSNASQLQQELSNTCQAQQSLSTASQLQQAASNVSQVHQALDTALKTQQGLSSSSQLSNLKWIAFRLVSGLRFVCTRQEGLSSDSKVQDEFNSACQLQQELSNDSHVQQTLSSVSQLQQLLSSVSQSTQALPSALQQELASAQRIQQTLSADSRLQDAPRITNELQTALSTICQLKQDLNIANVQQELATASRLQQKLSTGSAAHQLPGATRSLHLEQRAASDLHQAIVTATDKLQQLSISPSQQQGTTNVSQQGQLWQELCACLEATDLPEAISRCLCADHMPSHADLQSWRNHGNSADQTSQPSSGSSPSSSQPSASPNFDLLTSWWRNVTSQGAGPDPHMSDAVYDQLLARFCGPATTVDVPTVTAPRTVVPRTGKPTPARKAVRTAGQAVAETGLIHSLLALYPDQVILLSDQSLRCVHLTGPPGTGKSVVLVLKATQWLHQGHDVHLVSMTYESRAVSILIERQLQCVLATNPVPGSGTVHRHDLFDDVIKVDKMAALASGGELYVIADEVYGAFFFIRYFWADRRNFENFISELHAKVPSLSVWCASVQKLASPPSWMCQRQLTAPLRCPPSVTKEVAKSKEMKESDIPSYSSTPSPAATEGPPVRWLEHKTSLPDHKAGSALSCTGCGDAVVRVLKELGVGQSSGADSLQCRDVLILAGETTVATEGNHTKRASKGIVGALRASGFPVKVIKRSKASEDDLRDVALAVKDEIVVADYKTVSGLERRIVIGMGTTEESAELKNRLFAMSRCTAQLVWIGKVTKR